MPREVARSINRSLPEWTEAMEVLSRSTSASFVWAFPAIMVVRAHDDEIPKGDLNQEEIAGWIRGEVPRV